MSKLTLPTTPPEDGDTRASFLRKAGLGSAALVGSGALLGGPGTAFAGHEDSIPDVDILNYALTLEYLEATFYTQALGGKGTTGVPDSKARFGRDMITDAKQLDRFAGDIRDHAYNHLRVIRNHEITHVDFLRKALGDKAVGPCKFTFSKALRNARSFLVTAQVLENTGVMAYDGGIRYVDAGDNLQVGAEIATVEARHAAYLNLINDDSPFPKVFDVGKKPSEIFKAASPFIVSCPDEVTQLFKRLP
ncbi:MAG: ferritin-like domain-containing protein [Solirubrobacteraceae bacterium]